MNQPTIHEATADVLKGIANPIRLQIVGALIGGPKNATAIHRQAEIRLSQSAVAQQLGVMTRAGILRAERRGVSKVYTLADNNVVHIVHLAGLMAGRKGAL